MLISKELKSFFVFYLPILIWMGFIFLLSAVPSLKIGTATSIELILRKIAHLIEYAVLALLFANIFYQFYCLGFKKVFVFSLLGSFLFSLSDEFHQTFVIGRSGNFFDVGVDLVGIIIGLILFWRYAVLIDNKKR